MKHKSKEKELLAGQQNNSDVILAHYSLLFNN